MQGMNIGTKNAEVNNFDTKIAFEVTYKNLRS